jgi:DNA-binding MarR family transcriptional regulator
MPPKRPARDDAADALVAVAPLVSRWIERLLAAHEPPLTVAQFLALRAIATQEVSGSELARRTGVSGPAASQLLSSLAQGGMIERSEIAEDRRRRALAVSNRGRDTLASSQAVLRERLASLLEELPRPDADALARALPQVEAALSGAPPPRRQPPPHPPARPRPGYRAP